MCGPFSLGTCLQVKTRSLPSLCACLHEKIRSSLLFGACLHVKIGMPLSLGACLHLELRSPLLLGAVWAGLRWFGLVWVGLGWFRLVRAGLGWFGLVGIVRGKEQSSARTRRTLGHKTFREKFCCWLLGAHSTYYELLKIFVYSHNANIKITRNFMH